MQIGNSSRKGNAMRFVLVTAALVLQVLSIGWLIVRYERVVQTGAEVRFKCRAYDPYDPLRGRYLNISIDEATTNVAAAVANEVDSRVCGCFARIEPSTNGLWCVAEVAERSGSEGIWVKPSDVRMERLLTWRDKKEGEHWSEFEERRKASPLVARVSFPDRFFVNEKIAPEAEEVLRKKTEEAVAVYRVLDGEIVLTGIDLNGRSILDCVK